MVDRAVVAALGIGAVGVAAAYMLTRPPVEDQNGDGLTDEERRRLEDEFRRRAPEYVWPRESPPPDFFNLSGAGAIARCDPISCALSDKPANYVSWFAIPFGEWRRVSTLSAEIDHEAPGLFVWNVEVWLWELPGEGEPRWAYYKTFTDYNPFSSRLGILDAALASRRVGGIVFRTGAIGGGEAAYSITGMKSFQVV